ncbi:hypothetical protein GOODEAATRI_025440, partial [Goodea atripinnis]
LSKTLMDGLFAMEGISNQMDNLFQTFREQFPRLCFLSVREIIQLLSFHPLVLKQQCFLRKCFKGVHQLEVEHKRLSNTSNLKSFRPSSENPEEMNVLGVFGSLQEHIAFQPSLGPNPDTLVWLCAFEKHLKLSMVKLIKQCAVLRSQLESISEDLTYNSTVGPQSCNADKLENAHPLLELLLDFPLQCLLVVEETFWCRGVLQALKQGSRLKLSNLKTYNSTKLKILGNVIRSRVLGSENKSLISKYAMMCLHALVQLAMNHGQQLSRLMDLPGVLETSFEWLSTMKYHINSEDEILECRDNPSCYVDVLNHHFQYGFEYYGPDDWLMVHTPSTEKATLGIVLALTRYRSGFVSGPSMSGRTHTVIQLGKALGQLVVVRQCSPSMGSAVVQRMLLGAIQAGVWLLLESVDLLSQGETVLLPSQLNLLFEMTDLRDASPSTVTRCGLVYFTQTDLWKAIWRSELDALSTEYKLDQVVQKMWNRMANDLFANTLSFLVQHALTSANHFERGSCENYGIQEITSFVRILRALLEHFVKELQKPNTILQKDKRGMIITTHELRTL